MFLKNSIEEKKVKQILTSFFDINDKQLFKHPSFLYKYDKNNNLIIKINISPNFGGVTYQYKMMNYDNKNNLLNEIVFNGVGKEFYDFGKVENSDGSISLSDNKVFTNDKYINKYHENEKLSDIEIYNHLGKGSTDKTIKKFEYIDDRLSKILESKYNKEGEKLVEEKTENTYDEENLKSSIVEGYSNFDNSRIDYRNVKSFLYYYDDKNKPVKEIKIKKWNSEKGTEKEKLFYKYDKSEVYIDDRKEPDYLEKFFFEEDEIKYVEKLQYGKKSKIFYEKNVKTFEEI